MKFDVLTVQDDSCELDFSVISEPQLSEKAIIIAQK